MRSLELEVGRSGALVAADISVTSRQRRLFQAAGRPVPPAQRLQLVVDTGASHSLVDEAVMRALGIPPTNAYDFFSASSRGVPDRGSAYAVELQLGSLAQANVLRFPVLELMAVSFVGEAYQGLLGRDVLNKVHLEWRGPSGKAFIQYP